MDHLLKTKKGVANINRSKIEEYIEKRQLQRQGTYRVLMQDSEHFLINNHAYTLVVDYKNAFDAEALADRFSSILSKYDHIVGDWGYGQLRLHGFYSSDNPQYNPEQGVQTIQDYLYEDCNFGCAYFIVHNQEVQQPRKPHRSGRRSSNRRKSSGNGKKHQSGAAVKEVRQSLRQPPLKERRNQEVRRVKTGKHRQKLIVKNKNNKREKA